ncbi:type II toxin-antitoxin system VapC family toxin [Mucilaginibacter psychrotolerans]|uniref:Ribonuclease VapC n=1 Tax=Mucilaginibacter psychrotolerans TaxID=1524096 RepID=A0A4Y8SJU1_9SPHI|nr:type II toxin-antitoxin system VapC family toxin [Mucilaginibacter psychrotolerans]TFF38915.1 type II toxin-antitoxin system VapC family toxin [Mucilaginibacter psychrotolerans]
MVIFDTNILIELYHGNPQIKTKIEVLEAETFYVSSITAAEFLVGARDKVEFSRVEKHLAKYNVIPITPDISEIFLSLFKTYSLSHRPGIADALIAATALYYQIPLFNLNKKHFQFIPGIELI